MEMFGDKMGTLWWQYSS